MQVSFLLQYFRRPHVVERYVARLQAVATVLVSLPDGSAQTRILTSPNNSGTCVSYCFAALQALLAIFIATVSKHDVLQPVATSA